VGHIGAVVRGGIIKLARRAVAAIVERDHAPACAGERGHPTGTDPVRLLVGCEAVNEDDGVSVAFIDKGEFDSAVMERWHWGCCIRLLETKAQKGPSLPQTKREPSNLPRRISGRHGHLREDIRSGALSRRSCSSGLPYQEPITPGAYLAKS